MKETTLKEEMMKAAELYQGIADRIKNRFPEIPDQPEAPITIEAYNRGREAAMREAIEMISKFLG